MIFNNVPTPIFFDQKNLYKVFHDTSLYGDGTRSNPLRVIGSLPTQTGNSGKYLTTDGTTTSWATAVSSGAWGSITGTLSAQTDLQSALNLKANLASPTFTGTVVLPSTTSIGTVLAAEIGYLSGVTSSIQTQLNSKLPSASFVPAGSNTQIQFNNSSAFGASANLTWDGSTFAVTGNTTITAAANTAPVTISGYSLTGANTSSLLNLSGTWSTSGTPTAIKLNITDSSSNFASLLLDLQVGGASKVSVRKDGGLILTPSTSTIYFGGTSSNTNINANSNDFTLYASGTTAAPMLTVRAIGTTYTHTSGTLEGVSITGDLTPTSGTGNFTGFSVVTNVNQTGGASGIYRGFYFAPGTITAVNDLRAFESTNGKVIFADTKAAGSGSLAGSLLDLTQTWNTTGNPTAIKLNITNTASGSSAKLLDLQVGGSTQISVSKAGLLLVNGSVNLYGSVTEFSGGSPIQWAGRSVMQSPSDGVLRISNNAQTDFGRLQFGGTTSSFPALKRSGTEIHARLADDSDYATYIRSRGFTAIGTGNPIAVLSETNLYNGLALASGALLRYSSTTDATSGTYDLGLKRVSAGLIQITDGSSGIGTLNTLVLAAGTATAGTAPLKFTSGTNLTTAEAGAVEWNGTNLFVTQTTGPTRKQIAYTTDITGTVSTVSVVSANGFAGTVANPSTTPAITLTTSITGLLKGNGTAISAATSGTDYSAGTSALATGILKSTTTTGALTIAVAGDFPTLNQNTTGSAATLTTARSIYGNNFDGSAALAQIIASTFGGTGNGFTKFSGPATAEKTFTLPNASATILTDNAAVTVAQGGTGRATSTTAYGLIAAGTTATGVHQTLAAGATTEILVGGGTSALPVWTTATGSGAPVRAASPTLTGTVTVTGQYASTKFSLTDGATIALDWANSNVQTVTLGGNRTFTFANPVSGGRYVIILRQDATGSRTVTWPTIKWRTNVAPTLTTTANLYDIITLIYDGTNYFGDISQPYT